MTKKEQCLNLYKDAFGDSGKFDTMLFQLFSDNIVTSEKDGIVTAMYFKIPCTLNLNGVKSKAYYIYAVTTHRDYRHRGLMSRLFAQTLTEPDTVYFLKPSSCDVIPFYIQAGFKKIIGTHEVCNATIEVDNNFKKLSHLCDKAKKEYPLMLKGAVNIEKLTFKYTLE